MEGRRRVTLFDQMSAHDGGPKALAGLTLDDVLGNENREKRIAAATNQLNSRTLFDIIREDPNRRDKKTWRNFKEKLRLKRAGAAWTSSVTIPTSDIPIPVQNNYCNRYPTQISPYQIAHRSPSNSDELIHNMTHQSDDSNTASNAGNTRAQFLRRSSSRMGSTSIRSESFRNADGSGNGPPGQNLRPQISRRNSTRFPTQSESSRRERSLNIRDDDDNDDSYNDDDSAREGTRRLPEERSLSAREAVVAQETAEAAAAAAAAAAAEEEESEDTPLGSANSSGEPVRMSLMDLLEETDRQMGLEGSKYIMDEEEEEEDEEEEEAEEEDEGGVEYNCCVCMVRHKGSAFIPCGHTFCRLCSRELFVSRGNCPLCNGFILEILDIF